jgi:hypothetical protein
VTGALLYGYLGGWMLTSTVAVLTASHARRPQWLSILAGAVWPLLAVAVAQMVLIAVIASVLRTTSSESADRTDVTPSADHTFVKTV